MMEKALQETAAIQAEEARLEKEEEGMTPAARNARTLLRRVQADALDICRNDITDYSLVWEGVRKYQNNDLAELERVVENTEATLPAEEPRQPPEIDGVTDSKNPVYLENLKMAFKKHDGTIFAAIKGADTGGRLPRRSSQEG